MSTQDNAEVVGYELNGEVIAARDIDFLDGRPWVPLVRQREAVALTEEQKKAIKQWLDMGDESLGLAHRGYFAKGGWAYEQLAALLQANNLREPT